MTTDITWVDARERHPEDGELVLGATTGRYPAAPDEVSSAELDFWLVLPMYFRHVHPVEDTDRVVLDCYRDSDGVVRLPLGAGGEEEVTHWASLPPLPGAEVATLIGAPVAAALAAATAPTA